MAMQPLMTVLDSHTDLLTGISDPRASRSSHGGSKLVTVLLKILRWLLDPYSERFYAILGSVTLLLKEQSYVELGRVKRVHRVLRG